MVYIVSNIKLILITFILYRIVLVKLPFIKSCIVFQEIFFSGVNFAFLPHKIALKFTVLLTVRIKGKCKIRILIFNFTFLTFMLELYDIQSLSDEVNVMLKLFLYCGD
jgi:hypothetical protein